MLHSSTMRDVSFSSCVFKSSLAMRTLSHVLIINLLRYLWWQTINLSFLFFWWYFCVFLYFIYFFTQLHSFFKCFSFTSPFLIFIILILSHYFFWALQSILHSFWCTLLLIRACFNNLWIIRWLVNWCNKVLRKMYRLFSSFHCLLFFNLHFIWSLANYCFCSFSFGWRQRQILVIWWFLITIGLISCYVFNFWLKFLFWLSTPFLLWYSYRRHYITIHLFTWLSEWLVSITKLKMLLKAMRQKFSIAVRTWLKLILIIFNIRINWMKLLDLFINLLRFFINNWWLILIIRSLINFIRRSLLICKCFRRVFFIVRFKMKLFSFF